jgi:tetratricopeptide (TPR) repeat protein
VSAASAIVGLGVAVLLLVPLLPESALLPGLWAVEPLRAMPLAVRSLLAAGVAATLLPSVQQAFVRGAEAARARWWLVAAPASLALFGLLRQRNLRLGDSAMLTQLLEQRVHLEGHLVSYDEPLELYLHSLAYRALHALLEWDVAASYALLSSLAGLGFLVGVVVLWRDADGSSRIGTALAVLLTLATPSLQLFFGYVENYTLVALASLVYAIAALRSLERGLSPLWPAFALGFAISLHVLAGWLGPSLLYVFWRSARGRPAGRRIGLLVSMGAASLAPIAATIGWMTAVGVPLAALGNTHLAALKFIFLVDPGAPHYVYPAWSAAHWRDIANQLVLTSLAPLFLIAVLVRGASGRGDPRLHFFALGAGFLHVFAMTWNAENGAYNDWDLFALAGFFDAMLAARLVQRVLPCDARRLALALPAAAVGFALTAGFVWANAARTLEIPPGHARAHLRAGLAHAEAGRDDRARSDFVAALRIDPDDAELQFAAGSRLWNAGEREHATPALRRFLEQQPDDPRAPALRSALGADATP